jgi:hypothetical protein
LSITFFWNWRTWIVKDEKIADRASEFLKKDKEASSFSYNDLLSKDEYFSIEEKNLFHPNRKTSFLTKNIPNKEENEDKIIDEYEYPVLYGTLILGNKKLAILKFKDKDKENKKKTYTLGDIVGGSKLAKILPDRVILEGRERKTILLNDPDKPKKRKVTGKTPLKRKKEKKVTKKIEVPSVFKTSKDEVPKFDEKEKAEIRKTLEEVRKLTPF